MESKWLQNIDLRECQRKRTGKGFQGGQGQTGEIDLYGSGLKEMPAPRYVVFYNGTKEQPDRMELKFSDAFEPKDNEASVEGRAAKKEMQEVIEAKANIDHLPCLPFSGNGTMYPLTFRH